MVTRNVILFVLFVLYQNIIS